MKKRSPIVTCFVLALLLTSCGKTSANVELDENLTTREEAQLRTEVNGTEESKFVDTTTDFCPAVMVDGVLYFDTGKKREVLGKCGNFDGEITSQCDQSQLPEMDNQSNFGIGYGYQIGASEGSIELKLDDGQWYVFEVAEEAESF
jgi:hypothetical protein